MEIIETGNIFDSKAQTIVNTVNCLGVMGKGLALQFKRRYPSMFVDYEAICRAGLLDIGKLWIYKTENRWILNFPTKYDWRKPTREEYLEAGLKKFLETYKQKGITSIAFPLLGARNGGLNPVLSLELMSKYIAKCDTPVYIYLRYEEPRQQLFTDL